MDIASLMQETDSNDYLGCIKFDLMLWESTNLSKNFIKFATFNEWHDKVKAKMRLEAVLHATEEWVISCQEDVSLKLCDLDHTVFKYLVLPDSFDCIILAILIKFSEVDAPKSTST